MAETSRDRIAYYIWCAKHNRLGSMRDGDNHLLKPPEELELNQLIERNQFYEVADLILEMLQNDILKLVVGGVSGLATWEDPWSESVRDCLNVLGWVDPIPKYREADGTLKELEEFISGND